MVFQLQSKPDQFCFFTFRKYSDCDIWQALAKVFKSNMYGKIKPCSRQVFFCLYQCCEIPASFNTDSFNIHNMCLKGQDIISVVSLFYFMCKCPLIIFFQEVNENSLQRLSVYLENLQKPGVRSLKPTQLTFYVRETDQNSSDGQEPFSTFGTFPYCQCVLCKLHVKQVHSV